MIPSSWRDFGAWQRIVAENLNPILRFFNFTDANSDRVTITDKDGNAALVIGDAVYLTSPGNAAICIDNNNNGSGSSFTVRKDTADPAAGTVLFKVEEDGSVVSLGTLGYGTGAGGSVTQGTNRTTGVTINKACGAITLVSAAGSASWQSFTVTNSVVDANDTVVVNQQSGADLYMIHVTAIGAGSFRVTFATTGGTTTEQPVFVFSVIKGVAA